MTMIEIELPEAIERAARDAGLLTPEALERLLNDALKRRQAIDSLMSIANRVADSGVPSLTDEERSPLANITVSLPDDLAQQAQAAGLLRPAALEAMLREAIKRRDINDLFASIDKLNALEPAITEKEIDAEIAAARTERARRR